MTPIALTAAQVATANGGVIRHADLIAHGWPPRVVDRFLAGQQRLTRGAYALTLPDEQEALHLLRARALLLTRWSDHCLSHATAALSWGLPLMLPTPERVSLTTMTGTHGRSRGEVRLYGQPLPRRDVVSRFELPVTSVTRTVLDCGRTLPLFPATAIADAALHRGLTSERQLIAALKAMKGWTGVGMARAVLAHADPAAESPGETRCRLALREAGIRVRSQVVIRHRGQFLARADFQVEDARVLIEFDGRSKYAMNGDVASAHWDEKRRHDALVALGYEVLRVTWEDLRRVDLLRTTVLHAIGRAEARHRVRST